MSRVERDPERGRAAAARLSGHRDVDNTVLAHRLCNRIDYSMSVRGRPNPRDLEKVTKARGEAIRGRRS
jgi:hypothetical protein